MKKKIAVFTGTRAEYGLMKTLIRNLHESSLFELFLIVSSTHLSTRFGTTIEEIKKDNIPINYLLEVEINTNKKIDMALQTSEIIKVISGALEEIKPDYLVLLGDRFESFGAAAAAHILGIKIIHLHGGETTLGAIDNKLRHSITQLSSFHFTSALIHKKKVIEITGSKENVFNIGPLVLDGLLNLKLISKKDFEDRTGFNFGEKNLLITYHPETNSKDLGISGFENLLEILKKYNCNILFTSPNADTGSDKIHARIIEYVGRKNNCLYIPSLGQELYLNTLLLFDCIIGNSSSGIIEAPLLKRQVINIGNRQQGRYKFGKVLDTKNDYKSISTIVDRMFKSQSKIIFDLNEFHKEYLNKSPSKKIIDFLLRIG